MLNPVARATSFRQLAFAFLGALSLLLPSQASQPPAEPAAALHLQQSSPQEAFAALGQQHGAEFRLADDEQWIGPDSGVTVNADLREMSFWEAVQELTRQTSYEPVFRPYGTSDRDQPIIWLRRLDVAAEEKPSDALAAGPLLVRATEARVTIDLRTASLRMAAPQAAVRVELFLEPKAASALYVTAAAVRAFDEEGESLRRAEGHDPTTRIEGGTGELLLHVDAVKRIPTDVARWQAIMRVVESKELASIALPVSLVADTRGRGIVAKAPAVTRPASAPSTRAAGHQLGPYRVSVDLVRIGERQPDPDSPGGPPRVATVQCILPRGEVDPTAWSRLYGFLWSAPPVLAVENGAGASPWRLTGYAVFAVPSAEHPDEAGAFRVWAQYQAQSGAGDPAWLRWDLPAASAEVKVPVVWEKPLVIQPRAGAPATGPAQVP